MQKKRGRPSKSEKIREYILANPGASLREIQYATGFAKRTVMYAREKMVKEGLLPPSRQTQPANTLPIGKRESKPIEIPSEGTSRTTEIINGKTMYELANEEFDEDIIDDADLQKNLMKEVRGIAFNPVNHPDVRLSAIQIMVKLKDLEKTKDLGPGPPRTKDEIIIRMSRLMKGIGLKLTLEAFEATFPMSKKVENLQTNEI